MFKGLRQAATFDKPGLNLLVFGMVVCVTATFGVTGYAFFNAQAAGTRMYFSPAKGSAMVGAPVIVDVRADSLSQLVNAAEVDVDYPISKLHYEGYDAQGGAFEVQANIGDTPGTVRIARGTTTPVAGDFKILSLRFTAIASGKARLAIDPSSALVSSPEATNVLSTYGIANFNLTRK